VIGLPFLALSAIVQPAVVPHTFVYEAEAAHQTVAVAGTFNNWSRSAHLLQTADGRTWRLTVPVPVGNHQYKFVLDGERWVIDPRNPRTADDGGGNVNSLLFVAPEGFEVPAQVGDGQITVSALAHRTELPFISWEDGRLTLVVHTRRDDVESVEAKLGNRSVPLRLVSQSPFYATFSAEVTWDRRAPIQYEFVVRDGEKTFALQAAPNTKFSIDPAKYKPLDPPDWVQDAIIYQIFPDRFENGATANDPADVRGWTEAPTYYSFHGGDLAGVRKKLGYLADLGVNTIYFNPIFEGPSNHRYETTDYFKVDPRLGTNAEFADLTREMERRGIRTVLDGVFNHTSVEFAPFKDIRQNGPASKFADWYFVRSYPVRVDTPGSYEAWFGFPSMPKVNLENKEAADYMLGVPRYWDQRARVHGWRLDVANEVSMDFWRQFRQEVKSLGEDRWILGEVWTDATPWLQGDQWDSAMNYRFRETALGFIATGRLTPSEAIDQLMSVHLGYGAPVSRNLFNLLSSHDTPRFFTMCEGDRQLAHLGAFLQFTWVGAPSVYYGEELGMDGGRDPDNRRGIAWPLATDDNPTLRHYRALTDLRRTLAPLRRGDVAETFADDAKRVVAYRRTFQDEEVIVVINRSDETQSVTLPWLGQEEWLDVWNSRPASAGKPLTIPPLDGAVFVRPSREANALRDRLAARVPAP